MGVGRLEWEEARRRSDIQTKGLGRLLEPRMGMGARSRLQIRVLCAFIARANTSARESEDENKGRMGGRAFPG